MECVEFLVDEFLDAVLGGGVNHVVACTRSFRLTSRIFQKADFLENRPDEILV